MDEKTLATLYAVRKKLDEVSVRGIDSINAIKACMDTLTDIITEASRNENQDE